MLGLIFAGRHAENFPRKLVGALFRGEKVVLADEPAPDGASHKATE
jgi:hypothetical protein